MPKTINFNTPDFIKNYLISNNQKITTTKLFKLGKILNDLNDLMLDEIILNNYPLRVGNAVYIKLVRKERNFDKLIVNWGESNKLKKQIIERGEKPASKIGTSPNGNPIFDDGKKWMVFFIDDFYLTIQKIYTYEKISETKYKKLVPNSIFWKFDVSSEAFGRLTNYVNTNKINKLTVPLYERNKNYIL
jgi:hypothetical protein